MYKELQVKPNDLIVQWARAISRPFSKEDTQMIIRGKWSELNRWRGTIRSNGGVIFLQLKWVTCYYYCHHNYYYFEIGEK